jgi:hypothetical protein
VAGIRLVPGTTPARGPAAPPACASASACRAGACISDDDADRSADRERDDRDDTDRAVNEQHVVRLPSPPGTVPGDVPPIDPGNKIQMDYGDSAAASGDHPWGGTSFAAV